MRWTTVVAIGVMLFALRTAVAVGPRDSLPLDTTSAWPRDYRLHVEIEGTAGGQVRLTPDLVVPLVGAGGHDVAVEHPASGAPVLRVWSGGILARGPEEVPGLAQSGARDFPEARVRLDADYTAVVRFRSSGEGTLFARCPAAGKWAPDSKALFIRDGRLVFDIGWLGAMSGASVLMMAGSMWPSWRKPGRDCGYGSTVNWWGNAMASAAPTARDMCSRWGGRRRISEEN